MDDDALTTAIGLYEAAAMRASDPEAAELYRQVASTVRRIVAAKRSGDVEEAKALDLEKSRLVSDSFIFQPPEFRRMNQELHKFLAAERVDVKVRLSAAE